MTDPDYADMALKFVEHFLWIASSMAHLGERHGDVGRGGRLLLRRAPPARRPGRSGSRSGRWSACCRCARPRCSRGSCWRSTPSSGSGSSGSSTPGPSSTPRSTTRRSPASPAAGSASILDETKLRRVLAKMLDENEFLSAYGIRSLSRYHAEHPYVIHAGGQEYRVAYLPAESDTGMFGGNSNWRGPIWMPVNALIIRALLQYYVYYGDDFTVECPTGSGRQMNLYQVAEEIARRLANIFLRDEDGRRPVYGGTRKFQDDPHWRDLPAVLRVLPRRQRGRPRGQPPDRLDRDHRPAHAPVRDPDARAGPGRRQEVVFRDAWPGRGRRFAGRSIASVPPNDEPWTHGGAAMNAPNLIALLNATALVTMMLVDGAAGATAGRSWPRPGRRVGSSSGLLANYALVPAVTLGLLNALPGRPDGLGGVPHPRRHAPGPRSGRRSPPSPGGMCPGRSG